MPLSTKTKELVDKIWEHIKETSEHKAIYFYWQKLDATAIDSSSKVVLLSLISDRYDAMLKKYETADVVEQMQYLMPEMGQLVFLFHKVMSIPEIDP